MIEPILESPESPDLRVVREVLTYEKGGENSYFRDLARNAADDVAATERLDRHALEQRVNPDRTQGYGGYFAPPRWLVDDLALAPRPGAVLARLIPRYDLPAGAQSVNVPRFTTGTVTSTPADDGGVVQQDVVDTSVSSPAVPFAGQADVSMQLFEQSAVGSKLDEIVFKDLLSAYDAQLETMLINGTGTGGQFLGILNVSGVNSITYTSGSPTATGMFSYLGQAVAAIGKNRRQPPETWLMTTARFAWLASSEDSQNRPLMLADSLGTGNADLLSFHVGLDDAIPTTLAATNNQDVIIACKPSDMMLFESRQHTSVMLDVLSGTMQARFQLHGYAAALVGRYPSGISIVSGTGMVVQSGF